MLDRASSELLGAANELQALVALDRQLKRALAALEPLPRSEVPPWLWNAAWAREAIAAELAQPSQFIAWRLGEWAKKLPPSERAAVLDRAIEAFEALIPTPVGPGNDAGPFCEVADELSLAQTRRAWRIVERMRGAGWGEEADNATLALGKRLVALGHRDEAEPLFASVRDVETFEAPPIVQRDRRAALEEWNAGEHDWTGPRAARLVRELAGSAAIELLRERLLGTRPRDVIERALAEFLSDPDPRFAWVKQIAAQERFLPLYLGWTEVLGVRPDQRFARWEHEATPPTFTSLKEPYWQRLAICEGVRRFPALTMLMPDRPEAAITCGTCHGAGGFEGRPDLTCACGGLGWLLPGEPLPG